MLQNISTEHSYEAVTLGGYPVKASVTLHCNDGDNTLTIIKVHCDALFDGIEAEIDGETGTMTVTSRGDYERDLLRIIGEVIVASIPENKQDF